MKHFTLVFTIAILIFTSATAQKFLAIDKSGKIKRLRFYVNDKINIRLEDENFFRSGYIDAIEDTSFIFDGKNIAVSNVNAILVYKNKGGHALMRELNGKLPAAGIILIVFDFGQFTGHQKLSYYTCAHRHCQRKHDCYRVTSSPSYIQGISRKKAPAENH